LKFFLDHDVPADTAVLLRYWGHDVVALKEVLPISATDEAAFAYACAHGLITITCNRDDYLGLARQHAGHPGVIVLVRRRTRQLETSRLLTLLTSAGEQGLAHNINFA